MLVHDIELPKPPIGNKIFLAQMHGFYVLERGPALWRAMANTHMGNGSISVYDGIPNEQGQFPPGTHRMIFNASPPILGMWMFDGYCEHGITLALNDSGQGGSHAPCVTITWMPKVEQKRQIENVR